MSSSRFQTTLTGFPSCFDSSAASAAKSGLLLRPNPPPSSVTWHVTFFLSMPSAAATVSCAACGFWVDVHTSHLPSLNSATAAGGSIAACASMGVV